MSTRNTVHPRRSTIPRRATSSTGDELRDRSPGSGRLRVSPLLSVRISRLSVRLRSRRPRLLLSNVGKLRAFRQQRLAISDGLRICAARTRSLRGAPARADITKIPPPSRVEPKAISRPSGDHAGPTSRPNVVGRAIERLPSHRRDPDIRGLTPQAHVIRQRRSVWRPRQ